MVPIVLVAGAWLGGWCWKRVTPLLRAQGHEVYPATLTGLGDRRHLARPDIDLDTHVQDIVNVLEFEELVSVILVGHSYSGMVITGVAEQTPERLAHLVYVDASVPQDAESLFGRGPSKMREYVEAQARSRGDGWRWPLPEFEELSRFSSLADLTDADRQWFRSNAAAQPLKTLDQPLRVTNPRAAAIPRTYIYCTAEREDRPLPDYVRRVRDRGNWRFRELAAGHWPMFSKPQQLADLILEAASR